MPVGTRGATGSSKKGAYDPNRERFPDFEAVIDPLKRPASSRSPTGPSLARAGDAPNRDELVPAIQAHGNGLAQGRRRPPLPPDAGRDRPYRSPRPATWCRDLGFGGLWYDFVDSLPVDAPCAAEHDHAYDTNGEAWTAISPGALRPAREADPDCLLIYRRSHANIHNKPYLTHLWPADAPFDYDKNRREVVVTQAYGEGC